MTIARRTLMPVSGVPLVAEATCSPAKAPNRPPDPGLSVFDTPRHRRSLH
jgi:hypothetical protein